MGGVNSSVGTVALVGGSKLAMNLGPLFWKKVPLVSGLTS